jgi:hypothetical protein
MLAVLEYAVEYFQKYVLARNPGGKQRFQEAQEWFLERFLSLGFISESGGEEGESNAYYCSHQLFTFAFNYLDRFCLGNSRMSIIGRGKERRRGALLLRKYLRDAGAASRPNTEGFASLEGSEAQVEFCRRPSCWSSEVGEEPRQAPLGQTFQDGIDSSTPCRNCNPTLQ